MARHTLLSQTAHLSQPRQCSRRGFNHLKDLTVGQDDIVRDAFFYRCFFAPLPYALIAFFMNAFKSF